MSQKLQDARRYMANMREERWRAQEPNLFDRDSWQQPQSATSEWHHAMLAIIRRTAEQRSSFTVGDLQIPATPDKRAVGAVLLEAARRGWIDPGGWVSGGNERHGRPIRQWFSNLKAA
jgi:hypothetical protein